MSRKVLTLCVVCLGLAAGALQAQQPNIFVVPGPNSNAQNVIVYTANPFAPVTGFVSGGGTFTVLTKADGTKEYAVANAGSQTVTVVDPTFANARSLGNLGQQATGALLTPDSKRLAVAAKSLHIFETTTDSDIVPSGVNLGPGVNVFDVAASLDSTRIFALGLNPAGGSQLSSIDASSTVVAGNLGVQGIATAVSVGNNGLVYVSTQNQILEVNPNTLTVTPGGTISVNARPGKLAFTPDGKYAVTVNQTPITGSAVLLIDLSSRAIANTVPNFGVVLDQILIINSTTFLATSTQSGSLYQLTLSTNGSLSITSFVLPGVNSTNVSSAVLSDEIGTAGRVTPQYLFAVIAGTLYRFDLTNNTLSGQFPLSIQAGGLSYGAPASSNAQPVTMLQYGNNQNVAAGATTLPIVVRVLDNNGRPLSGITVNWGTNVNAATVSPTTSVTGSNGVALTYMNAPATNGPVVVSATVGSLVAAFNIAVGSGGGGTPAGGLAIIAGQGQITFENFNTGISGSGSPLTVQVTDVNNNPVPGVSVTFTVAQGPGTILGGTAGGLTNSVVVTTDNTGQASASFLSSSLIQNGTGYNQTVINVSAPNTNSVNFYITTTAQTLPPTIRLNKPQLGDVLVGQAGTKLANAVVGVAVSGLGQPIPNVGLKLDSGNVDPKQFPSISCNDPNGTGVLTDATGTATCDALFNGKLGTGTFNVSIGYFRTFGPFNFQVLAGPPGVVTAIQGNNQTGNPGQKLPLALLVQVTDLFGNLLSGAPVTWQVLTPGAVTLSNVINATDSNGRASAVATLGNIAGAAQVKVTAGNASAIFTLNVNIPTAGIQKISGDGQTALVNATFTQPVTVKVVDGQGNPVNGAVVSFQVTGGTASVSSPSITTGPSGLASTNVTAGATATTITISASSSGFSVSFTLTSRLPGPQNVSFLNGASLQPVISPGVVAIVTGTGIATGVQGLVPAFSFLGPLPTSLAGISILFNNIPAPIFYVLNAAGVEQVGIQVPFEIQPGSVTVTINAAGGGNGTFNVQVQQFSPGVFVTGAQGFVVAIRPDGSYVSPNNPARRGEVIRLYVTGLGAVSPAAATNTAGVPGQNVVSYIAVGLNNAPVPFISITYAQGMIGVYEITLQLQNDAPTGPAIPFGVVAFDVNNNPTFSQGAFIPIQ